MKSMQKLPKHVAIVMDGNGRWAKKRNLPRMAGHEAGAQTVKKIIQACLEKKIEVLTLFAFGVENWGRPQEEVNFLMQLFLRTLQRETKQLHKNNIRLRIMGDSTRFSKKLRDKISQSQELTANNTGLTLVVAVNYSGRWDILQATQKIADNIRNHALSSENISYQVLQQALCLADIPEPDLFIRTSGEQRLSNFLLWQLAYTELYFTETLWPDFSTEAFDQALVTYALRQRRYGLTQEQLFPLNQPE